EFKDHLNEELEKVLSTIEKQQQKEREQVELQVRSIENALHKKQLFQSEIKHKIYFKEKIHSTQKEIDTLSYDLQEIETTIKQAKETRKNLEREWQLEKTGIEAEQERKLQTENEKIQKFEHEIAGITDKIKNSQESFYGWLNKNI